MPRLSRSSFTLVNMAAKIGAEADVPPTKVGNLLVFERVSRVFFSLLRVSWLTHIIRLFPIWFTNVSEGINILTAVYTLSGLTAATSGYPLPPILKTPPLDLRT
ncbi:hypothetical protein AA313_de0200326 [Arthrobotrys entomopaga]|nr:hypothetical protein AA313_de0200326 [Arthrobotrys entomopaga]